MSLIFPASEILLSETEWISVVDLQSQISAMTEQIYEQWQRTSSSIQEGASSELSSGTMLISASELSSTQDERYPLTEQLFHEKSWNNPHTHSYLYDIFFLIFYRCLERRWEMIRAIPYRHMNRWISDPKYNTTPPKKWLHKKSWNHFFHVSLHQGWWYPWQ